MGEVTFRSKSVDIDKVKSIVSVDTGKTGLTKIDVYSSQVKLPNGESRTVAFTDSGVSFMKGYWAMSGCPKRLIKREAKGILYVGDGWLFPKSTFTDPRHVLTLSLETCSVQECTTARKAIKSRLFEMDKLSKTPLDEDITIQDIYVGDMGNTKDGLTDILIVLSTGAGVLYEQTVAPVSCSFDPKEFDPDKPRSLPQ